jgi:hypothetical protein
MNASDPNWFEHPDFWLSERRGVNRDPDSGLYYGAALVVMDLYAPTLSLMDIGCGRGAVMKHLLNCGYDVIGADASLWALFHPVAPMHRLYHWDIRTDWEPEWFYVGAAYCLGVLGYLTEADIPAAVARCGRMVPLLLFTEAVTDSPSLGEDYWERSGRLTKRDSKWWQETLLASLPDFEMDEERTAKARSREGWAGSWALRRRA